jgi:hypothetical protein
MVQIGSPFDQKLLKTKGKLNIKEIIMKTTNNGIAVDQTKVSRAVWQAFPYQLHLPVLLVTQTLSSPSVAAAPRPVA